MAESREQSLGRIISEAKQLGADGIVAVHFVISSMMQGAAELLAYGTAVRLKRKA